MTTLISFKLTDQWYGIWKQTGLSVAEVRSVIRIPLSPVHITGMAKAGDKTVTLADMALCLGLDPPDNSQQSLKIIADSRHEASLCFTVHGATEDIEVPDESVIPLPPHLSTKIINTCIFLNNTLIPVINIDGLKDAVKSGLTESCIHLSGTNITLPQNDIVFRRVRTQRHDVILAADEFVIPDTPLPEPVQLPGSPEAVTGITLYNSEIVTCLQFPEPFEADRFQSSKIPIIARIADRFLSFSVHSDSGTIDDDYLLHTLPAVMQTDLITRAMDLEGTILPVLTVGNILNSFSCESLPGNSISQTPHFFSGSPPTEVSEMNFGGIIHAIPSEEIADRSISLKCHQIPSAQALFGGVVKLENDLIPVIDPAVCFRNRRSAAAEHQMILIKKDKDSFIILADSVSESVKFPEGVVQEVPVEQVHELVYGCYPMENQVRLILNISAIASHFTTSTIEVFEELWFQHPAPDSDEPGTALYDYHDVDNSVVAAFKAPPGHEPCMGSIIDYLEVSLPVYLPEPSRPDKISGITQKDKTPDLNDDDLSLPLSASSSLFAKQPMNVSGTSQPDDIFTQHSKLIESLVSGTEASTVTGKDHWQTKPDSERHHVSQRLIVEPEPEPSDTMPSPASLPVLSEPGLITKSGPGNPAESPPVPETSLSHKGTLSYDRNTTGSPSVNEFEKQTFPPLSASVNHQKNEIKHTPVIPEITNQYHYYRWVLFIPALIAVAIAVFFFSTPVNKVLSPTPAVEKQPVVVPDKPETELIHEPESIPDMTDSTSAGNMAPEIIPEPAPVKSDDLLAEPEPVNEPAPLPVHEFLKTETESIYTVTKGDTLWNISERFTGSGFNYPDLARENDIGNPDLIYPEQVIMIQHSDD